MGMSFSTVEEKKQVRWFVMRAYKNEKMAEDRLKDKEYGLEYFIPKHYAVKTYHGTTSCNSPCGKKARVWNISPCQTTRWTVSSK